MFCLENTYFSKLPLELIDYIWEFNHYGAACVINYNARKFITKSVRDLKVMVDFANFNAHLGVGMKKYGLFYRNRIMNKEDVFLRMKACQCCKRHQINKPKKLEAWNETEFHGTQFTPCTCICRHYSRFLCRFIE
tara:strand:+ start:150 stop:554 length:405 start_codon:yes stop_codon:yes gene_type:complete